MVFSMKLKYGFKELVAEAEKQIQTLSIDEVAARMNQDGVLLVDLRDIRELQREGKIPNAKHIPRGMLEFWIDPESPYYKKYFDTAKEIIFYCNKGWRSALSTYTVQKMGVENAAHLEGGFDRWKKDTGLVEQVKK